MFPPAVVTPFPRSFGPSNVARCRGTWLIRPTNVPSFVLECSVIWIIGNMNVNDSTMLNTMIRRAGMVKAVRDLVVASFGSVR